MATVVAVAGAGCLVVVGGGDGDVSALRRVAANPSPPRLSAVRKLRQEWALGLEAVVSEAAEFMVRQGRSERK